MRFQGIGHVKVNQHRPVVGKVKTVWVKREGRKWFVVLTAAQDVTKAPAPKPDPEKPSGFLSNGATAKAALDRSIY